MREDENNKSNTTKKKNWFLKWEDELPSPEELMPLSQSLITTDLALAFNITTPPHAPAHAPPPPPQQQQIPQNSSAEFDSPDLPAASDEPARTLKRPRLVWTPQLHKRFVDAVAHLGIKNAVPKTIMTLMSVDGLTRENVASHLQKYRLYLKRMQGVSTNGGTSGGNSSDDHLFASSPVPAHFLHQGRPNSDHFLPPFVTAATPAAHHQLSVIGHQQQTLHHHHQQQTLHHHHHQQVQGQFRHFGQFDHHSQFMRQSIGTPVHSGMMPPSSYVDDLESANANGGRKVLTLFPTGDDVGC